MEDCIFCKIIRNEIPSDKIYEDEDIFAFLDLRPTSRGHALVVPKIHSKDFLETTDDELSKVIVKVKKIAAAVMDGTGAAGFNLTTNTRAAAGQAVFHLHFHIIPRYQNDGLPMFPHHESEPKTRAELADHIKKFIK